MSQQHSSLSPILKAELCSKFNLNPSEIDEKTNLFQSKIDSLDYLKFSRIVAEIYKNKTDKEMDLILFLNEGLVTIEEIDHYLLKL